jgi:hypothetical protein
MTIHRNLTRYKELHTLMRRAGKVWNNPDLQNMYSNFFYQEIRSLRTERTPYSTIEATRSQTVTHDHWLAPRLVLRALMEERPEVLLDADEFYAIVDLCCSTVGVTSSQNSQVKFKANKLGLPIVRKLTRDKYDGFTWLHKTTGLVDRARGFPLKHRIPEWVTAFEMKCMKEHGYT